MAQTACEQTPKTDTASATSAGPQIVSVLGFLGDAKDMAENAKAILDLFGSHTYAVTLECVKGS